MYYVSDTTLAQSARPRGGGGWGGAKNGGAWDFRGAGGPDEYHHRVVELDPDSWRSYKKSLVKNVRPAEDLTRRPWASAWTTSIGHTPAWAVKLSE